MYLFLEVSRKDFIKVIVQDLCFSFYSTICILLLHQYMPTTIKHARLWAPQGQGQGVIYICTPNV